MCRPAAGCGGGGRNAAAEEQAACSGTGLKNRKALRSKTSFLDIFGQHALVFWLLF